ncbi:MAG: sensor histidine kinase [Thermomicrobiales bacterium]
MFDISLHPVLDAQGAVARIVPEGRDITEREPLERQKDEFLSVASHELKTPVTSIKAFARLLGRRFRKAGDLASAEMVAKIVIQLNRPTGLISVLLDTTKIESGQLQFRWEAFDVDSPVDEVVEQMHVTTDGHTIRPDGRAGRSIVADRDRTGQVLTNQLANAVTFSPVDGDIVVATAVGFARVSVTVCDHGMGISTDRQAREFDRFYRISEPLTDGSPSLGLGLFISAEIIRRRGGRLWVESQEGVGATFGFWLPPTSADGRKDSVE